MPDALCQVRSCRQAHPARGGVRQTALVVAIAAAALLAGCAPRTLLLKGMADELAAQGAAEEPDLGLARDAAPFYLKLSESVLRQVPSHKALAESVAAGFTQYAFAFVAFEAEKLQDTDARAALRQRQRAARLYERAHRHAMTALLAQQPGLREVLAAPAAALPSLAPEQVGLAYWAAASWGAAIALSKDRPEAVAELPAAVRLAEAAHAREPGHAQGQLAVLLAQFELARPGGSKATAERLLSQADEAAGGASASGLLVRAEALAQPAGDREAFERLLRQALAVATPRQDLAHQVLRQRAQWLLDTVDDRF
jgi:hypothetical protein